MEARIDGQVDIRALYGFNDFGLLAEDGALGIFLEDFHAGLAFEVVVHRQFDLRLPLHVRIVKIEFPDVRKPVEIHRRADIAKQVGRHGPERIHADRLLRDLDARQAEIAFGQNGHGFEIEVLHVIVRHLPVVAVMHLQPAGIVVFRHADFLEPRDDLLLHDFFDVGDGQILGHSVHGRPVAGGRDLAAVSLPAGLDHVREHKIDINAHAAFDERDAVAVTDLAADRGNAHGHARSRVDLGGVNRPPRDLDIPQPENHAAEGEENQGSKENQPEGNLAALHRRTR